MTDPGQIDTILKDLWDKGIQVDDSAYRRGYHQAVAHLIEAIVEHYPNRPSLYILDRFNKYETAIQTWRETGPRDKIVFPPTIYEVVE